MIRDTAYWEAMKVVPLIILANFFLGIYTNLSVWYKIIDKTHIGAYISLVGAAVTLALNLLLIPSYGYYGSAVATIAAYGSMMLISYVLGKRYYPIPYDGLRIGSYLGSSILFSALSFYFFRKNYAVGVGLILAYMAIIYFFEKETLLQVLRKSNTKK
jgi:O-antigen/teichoic acid export membrane protein